MTRAIPVRIDQNFVARVLVLVGASSGSERDVAPPPGEVMFGSCARKRKPKSSENYNINSSLYCEML
jgi:hypothetical protein